MSEPEPREDSEELDLDDSEASQPDDSEASRPDDSEGSQHDEDFELDRAPEPSLPPPERPDWLVGAEEGAQAEKGREGEREYSQPSPALRLIRPEPEPKSESESAKPASESKDDSKKKRKVEAWKAAASSVPSLRHSEERPARVHPARPAREPAWAEPDFGGAAPAVDAFAVDAADPAARTDASADEAADPLASATATAGRVVPLRPLDEPWWAVAVDTLRTSRAIQLGVLATLLAVLAWFLWPRSEPSVAIRAIQAHPERYNGVTVRVSGRVGDVYDVGGAYAYYLVQGRDTIVVFSRTRRPYRNEKLNVAGSISTGYLDGVARPSLFEAVEP